MYNKHDNVKSLCLLTVYEPMYNEYDNVKSLCLLTVYEPVYNEYDKLNTVYKIEKECRSEAERYASKVPTQSV